MVAYAKRLTTRRLLPNNRTQPTADAPVVRQPQRADSTLRVMPDTEDAPIHIAAYDPRWPALFEAERQLLAGVLGRWLVGPIEHVGSTAVPGLSAKPVVDIMAAVESLDGCRKAITSLRTVGYRYAPYRTDVMHWFCKPGFAARTHHLHLVPYRSPLWTERIAFRDLLREQPAIARDYAALKHQLAEAHRFDREAYTEAKGPFITRVVRDFLGQGRADAPP